MNGNSEEDAIASRVQDGGADDQFDVMLVHARRKIFRKRRLASLSFAIVGDQKIAVNLYKLFAVAKRQNHKWLHAGTSEPLKVLTRWIDGDTGGKRQLHPFLNCLYLQLYRCLDFLLLLAFAHSACS